MHTLPPRSLLSLLGVLLAAACERPAPPPPEPPPSAVAEPEIHAGLAWSAGVTGAGVSLVLSDAAGAPLLRLSCVRDRALMRAEVDGFYPIGSEERLSLGVDGEPFVFVADPAAERPSGVEAEAPMNAALLDRLEGAREVSAAYGAQTLGPHLPPDTESAALFVSACRRITAP